MSDQQPQDGTHRRHWLRPPGLDPKVLHHPAVVRHAKARAEDSQLRLADRITSVAGSMQFVYVHAVFFALWMLVFEDIHGRR